MTERSGGGVHGVGGGYRVGWGGGRGGEVGDNIVEGVTVGGDFWLHRALTA